jgi:hypothetical protein
VAYGLPEGEAAGWWVLGGTVALLTLAVLAFRYVDPRRMSLLKKCLIVSVLVHVLIAFFFSAVVVTRQVVRWAKQGPAMTPAVNLQLSREMQVREQVRRQVQELPAIPDPTVLTPRQADSPLPPASARIEPVGAPKADLQQFSDSRNLVAPTIPAAPAAPELTSPLLPIQPQLAPMPETTPLPNPAADVARQATHFPGELDERLATAASPVPGEGFGNLGAPPASLAQGAGNGGSATGSGTGKPFSLWDGKAPPPVRDKISQPVTNPPRPAPPQTAIAPSDLLPQRNFDQRQRQLQKHGGTPETEAAVARALVYLSRTQQPDGHWSKITDKPGEGTTDAHDNALTSLAVLCYLAAGNTPDQPGPYQQTVKRGIAYIMAHEGRDGDARGDGNMYDQGITSLALGEAASMSRQKSIREAARNAAQFIVDAQNGHGGWRYSPRDLFSDTSVMGWQILAMHSARGAGFQIPPQTLNKAAAWLDGVSTGKHGMLAGYITAIASRTMTAEATFSRMLIGLPLDAQQLDEVSSYLLSKLPAKNELNYYYIYYGSLVLMQMQGPAWDQWNANTSRLLLNLQESQGPLTGSWAPENSEWGDRGGRIYSTALATLTLEVYYRYLPTYTKPAK